MACASLASTCRASRIHVTTTASSNRRFFAAERLLLAPLVNLRQAGSGRYTLVALPLNIPGVCGTPVRAVLIEGMKWHDGSIAEEEQAPCD